MRVRRSFVPTISDLGIILHRLDSSRLVSSPGAGMMVAVFSSSRPERMVGEEGPLRRPCKYRSRDPTNPPAPSFPLSHHHRSSFPLFKHRINNDANPSSFSSLAASRPSPPAPPPPADLKKKNKQGKAQLISNINACQAVADAVRTTLGPRGMDKLVSDGRRVTISNDGATIMRLLEIEHPAAKTLVDISMSQVRMLLVGDGREGGRERVEREREREKMVMGVVCVFVLLYFDVVDVSGGGGCCDSSARCPGVVGGGRWAATYFLPMMKNPSHTSESFLTRRISLPCLFRSSCPKGR